MPSELGGLPAIAVAGLAAMLVAIQLRFNSIVPDPYMDELFHVRQTQLYCAGDFASWDPKITTLPGLYLLVVLMAKAMQPIVLPGSSVEVLCSASNLRLINLVFSIGCLVVFMELIRTIHPRLSSFQLVVKWAEVALFPVHFFFNFMFYTDTASTFLVLLCYYLALKEKNFLSFLSGASAVLARQTNVIWVVFVLATNVIRDYERGELSENVPTPTEGVLDVPAVLVRFISCALHSLPTLARRYWGHMITIVFFGIFVYINEGIVVGDRENHIAVLHVPQFLYFLGIATFSVPASSCTISGVKACASWVIKKPTHLMLTVLSFACMCGAAHCFTFAHPFLLADNRHYPFYLWKKLFARHWVVKLLAVPLYLFGLGRVGAMLGQNRSLLWVLVFLVGVATMLIPSPLLEFRYHLLPCLFVMLHYRATPSTCPHDDTTSMCAWRHALHALAYAGLNALLLWVFLYKPFTWPDQSTARFMW